MKIAICIRESRIGGVATSTYILASGMRQAGHEADILVTSCDAGDDYERARRDGWPVKAICSGTAWLRSRLKTTLEELSRYDVVINNHSIETQLVLPVLPSRITRLSVIRSSNDPVILGARINSQWLDAVIGISPEVVRLLKQSHLDCAVDLIPNACVVEGNNPPHLGLPLRIVYVGRLSEPEKNILIIPKIALCLLNRGCEFMLRIVGEGNDRERLQQRTRELGLNSRTSFIGAVAREAVKDLFENSHFSLFPSNYEGFGLALIEAMATGSVPVASDIAPYRWILGEDAALLCAPVKDPEAYATRLCAIAADSGLYSRLQERLRQRQREYFTPQITVERFLKLIDELRTGQDSRRFRPVPFGSLVVPEQYKRQFSILWQMLRRSRRWFRRLGLIASDQRGRGDKTCILE